MLILRLSKREDQALIPISTILDKQRLQLYILQLNILKLFIINEGIFQKIVFNSFKRLFL